MSETIRVLLADDDVIVREGLADLLNQQDGIDVVAVAENGSEALRELSKQTVDVALLDVDMPVLDGLATAKEMARLRPSVAVVMLTVFEHEESLIAGPERAGIPDQGHPVRATRPINQTSP